MTDDIILEASHVSMIYGHNKARAAQLMFKRPGPPWPCGM